MQLVKPQPGDPAPDFSLQADDGSTVSRESQLGKRYVLYFYPKDDTTGCTAQACSMRDNFGRVTSTGIEVFGVSPDSVKSHVKFREKYDLPYRLLADTGHAVADAFGVWVDKTYMGRSYQGVERSSFIIGPDGRIEHVLERVKPMEHVDLILDALAA
ncbi:MAG TPA: thioredoxin-dependent thiol peroxidase [Candidatus Limnocylindria bacterium]|nr:thioredoxin-dependent thiol peroxidase [Candidatus Limnocylindria bacterium]